MPFEGYGMYKYFLNETAQSAESAMSELDKAWQEINALGGHVAPDDDHGLGYIKAIGDALDIIEKLGGKDPLQNSR
jgi:hypothetical protein